MTERTFTAAIMEARAVQLDDAAACSVGARAKSLRTDAAMLRQGAAAESRWEQLKASVTGEQKRGNGLRYKGVKDYDAGVSDAYEVLLHRMARLEGKRP